MTPFIGQIIRWGMPWVPGGWLPCDGRKVASAAYPQLFQLIGTTYGGDATNFALPNMNGFVALGVGQGRGLSNYALGATGGGNSVVLAPNDVSGHSHVVMVANQTADQNTPSAARMLANEGVSVAADIFNPVSGQALTVLNNAAISMTTGHPSPQAHENRQPFLTVNYCIAVAGLYPA